MVDLIGGKKALKHTHKGERKRERERVCAQTLAEPNKQDRAMWLWPLGSI